MKRQFLLGSLVSVLIASCGQETDSDLSANSSSPVLAATLGCQQGVVAKQAANKTAEVSGVWSGSRALSSLKVGNVAATLSGNQWKASVPSKMGLNLFEVVATDSSGQTFRNTCAVYAAGSVTSPKTLAPDSVLLSLHQGAFDDKNDATNPIASIADLLRIAANSGGIRTMIHEELKAASPLVEKANRSLRYRKLSFGEPEIAIDLVEGGLAVKLRIPSLRVEGIVKRTVGLIQPERDFAVKISYVEINPTFTIGLDNRKNVTVAVKDPMPTPKFGSFDTDIDGGILPEIAEEIVNGQDSRIKKALGSSLKKAIQNDLSDVLEAQMKALAIGALPTSKIVVPKMDRSANTTINVVSKLGDLDFKEDQAFVSVSTRVDGAEEATETEWIPASSAPIPAFFTEAGTAKISGGAVSSTLFNQVLYRLWKNGNFQMASVPGLASSISSATVKFDRPPVLNVNGNGTGFNLGVGPITFTMNIAGASVQAHIYAEYNVPVSLSDSGEFTFGNVTKTLGRVELPQGFSWAESTIETVFFPILTKHFNAMFTELEPVQLPSFEIPQSLSRLGLPAKVKLGILEPKIEKNTQYVILKGAFGETFRPVAPAPRPQPEPASCTNGAVRRESCAAGYTGYHLAECINGDWRRVQDLCVRSSGGGGIVRPDER